MKGRTLLEWIVLAISALAIVALVGVLLAEGLAGPHDDPDPVVELALDEGRQGTHAWFIPATVTNIGGDAAEDVLIEFTATVAGTEETSELTVAFLPARSTVQLEVGFSARPEGEVAVRVVGYARP